MSFLTPFAKTHQVPNEQPTPALEAEIDTAAAPAENGDGAAPPESGNGVAPPDRAEMDGAAPQPASDNGVSPTTNDNGAERPSTPGSVQTAGQELLEVDLDRIDLGPNVRKSDAFDVNKEDDLQLVVSVNNGQEQPGLAQRKPDNRFELLYGFRRFEARKAAGCKTMLLMVTDQQYTPEQVIEKQLVENTHRKDMNPLDRAEAYAALKKKYKTNKEVARKVGVAEARVSESLELIKYLPADSKEALRTGKLTLKAALKKVKEIKEGKGSHKKPADQHDASENGDEQTPPSEDSSGKLIDQETFVHKATGIELWAYTRKKKHPGVERMIKAVAAWLDHLQNPKNRPTEEQQAEESEEAR